MSYPAGWNLIGASSGTVISGVIGPLYTLGNGDTSYRIVPTGAVGDQGQLAAGLQAGKGFWAYFAAPTTLTLPFYPTLPTPGGGFFAIPFAISPPVGGWIMIGNPYNVPVSVTGADVLFVYDQSHGYQLADTLQPGQGAVAYSATGYVILLCPTDVTCD